MVSARCNTGTFNTTARIAAEWRGAASATPRLAAAWRGASLQVAQQHQQQRSNSNAEPVAAETTASASTALRKSQPKERIDQYATHILWVAGLRINEKEIDLICNNIKGLGYWDGKKVSVHKRLLNDDELDGRLSSFDCDLLILVMSVGSGNRCDVERAFGEMVYHFPSYFEGMSPLSHRLVIPMALLTRQIVCSLL